MLVLFALLRWPLGAAAEGMEPPVGYYEMTAEVRSVAGYWVDGSAQVVLETGSEFDSAGFRISRFDPATRAFQPLHEGMLPINLAQPDNGRYRVSDPLPRRGEQGTYLVEELRMHGGIIRLGEFALTFQDPPPPEPAPRPSPLSLQPVLVPTSDMSAGTALKVPVTERGVFSVAYADIATGLSRTVEEVATLAAGAQLGMRNGEDEVAYINDAAGSRLLFYGWPSNNRYTRENFFWIEPRAGTHMARIAPGGEDPGNQYFISTRHEEQDKTTLVYTKALRDDLFYWEFFTSLNATYGERTFSLPLDGYAADQTLPWDGYAAGDIQIAVDLIGWSDLTHTVEIYCNSTLLGTMSFNMKDEARGIFQVPAGSLLPANNLLKIKGITSNGGYFVLDGFDLSYMRTYEPAEPLFANDGGNAVVSVSSFDDPLALEISDPRAPRWIADESGALTDEVWAVTAAPESYVVVERDAIVPRTPVTVDFDASTWMSAVTNAVDYLIIAPRALVGNSTSGAQRLADYRAQQGLRVRLAAYEDICDRFAEGLDTPEAIRAFLIQTRTRWRQAPWMVLLAGHGHTDFMGNATTEPNHLPPLVRVSAWGQQLFAHDAQLADLALDDGIPEIALGRIPAQTLADMDYATEKIITYETAGHLPSQNTMWFFAGKSDSSGDFAQSNRDLSEWVVPDYTAQFTHHDDTYPLLPPMQTAIQSAFTNGMGIIHYTGHGAYNQFSGEKLLTVSNVDNASHLNPNGSPVPLFVALTCLLNRYEGPKAPCLGERLVLRQQRGALAVFAPCGYSWNSSAAKFARAFYQTHVAGRQSTLGLALLTAWRSVDIQTNEDAESLRSYVLLGDPALKLRGGMAGDYSDPENFAQWRWDHFSAEGGMASGLANPEISGPGGCPEPGAETNLAQYVMGLIPSDGAVSGPLALSYNGEDGIVVEFRRRTTLSDVAEHFLFSLDLQSWEVLPPEESEILSVTPDPDSDGRMEIMRARILWPLESALFLRREFEYIGE
ncbi:MAG: hypothetical protein KBA51_06910 [Kiritimatiellae bacterium]|nr:hypothetical protein [Kiritimatiellia bacterium]